MDNTTVLKNKLYQTCQRIASDDEIDVFNQNDIERLEIGGLEDPMVLLKVVQVLVDERLFKPVTDDGALAWKIRSMEDANRYRLLSQEQATVYEHIDDAGADGLWTKTIKMRTNLHDTLFNAAIKFLVSKNYIRDMKSVEHPSRKMWIKASLQPSERSTGGPWYTDGELDEEFIAMVIRYLTEKIVAQTFYVSKIPALKKPKKVHSKKMSPEEAKAARAAGLGPLSGAIEDAPAVLSEREQRRQRFESFLPMPITYKGYPTVDELTLAVLESGLTTIVLTAADVQQLLDVMIFDDKITRVVLGDRICYKAQRSTLRDTDELGSTLGEAPCGRCPVFDLCEEGGPVGPSNCEYFDVWLNQGL